MFPPTSNPRFFSLLRSALARLCLLARKSFADRPYYPSSTIVLVIKSEPSGILYEV